MGDFEIQKKVGFPLLLYSSVSEKIIFKIIFKLLSISKSFPWAS